MGLSPHCSSPGNRALWQREEGRNGVDGQDLLGPAASGQQGEQQAHCAPKSDLPLPTWAVLLGLPRSCLTPSRIDELSECAGNMNRLLHVLLTWPVRVHHGTEFQSSSAFLTPEDSAQKTSM